MHKTKVGRGFGQGLTARFNRDRGNAPSIDTLKFRGLKARLKHLPAIKVSGWNRAGLQPLSVYKAHTWGVAPGWHGAGRWPFLFEAPTRQRLS